MAPPDLPLHKILSDLNTDTLYLIGQQITHLIPHGPHLHLRTTWPHILTTRPDGQTLIALTLDPITPGHERHLTTPPDPRPLDQHAATLLKNNAQHTLVRDDHLDQFLTLTLQHARNLDRPHPGRTEHCEKSSGLLRAAALKLHARRHPPHAGRSAHVPLNTLAHEIAALTGLNATQSEQALRAVLTHAQEDLLRLGHTSIPGLGTFCLKPDANGTMHVMFSMSATFKRELARHTPTTPPNSAGVAAKPCAPEH